MIIGLKNKKLTKAIQKETLKPKPTIRTIEGRSKDKRKKPLTPRGVTFEEPIAYTLKGNIVSHSVHQGQ